MNAVTAGVGAKLGDLAGAAYGSASRSSGLAGYAARNVDDRSFSPAARFEMRGVLRRTDEEAIVSGMVVGAAIGRAPEGNR